MKTVYLAGPITGLTFDQATEWRNNAKTVLRSKGYRCIDPMEGESDTLNHKHKELHRRIKEIVDLDYFYVNESDIIFADFTNCSDTISVGTLSEISWAWGHGAIIVAVVPEDCPYDLPWLNQLFTFKVPTYKEGLKKVLEIQ